MTGIGWGISDVGGATGVIAGGGVGSVVGATSLGGAGLVVGDWLVVPGRTGPGGGCWLQAVVGNTTVRRRSAPIRGWRLPAWCGIGLGYRLFLDVAI